MCLTIFYFHFYVRSAVLLDVVAISALIIYGSRVVLGYKQTWDRYQVDYIIFSSAIGDYYAKRI